MKHLLVKLVDALCWWLAAALLVALIYAPDVYDAVRGT